ncbi:MAG: 4Fe-4S binding protein [Candidatus Hydrothermarchaeota archaeon]
MTLNIDPLKCVGCGACEVACSFHRDETFSTLSSSIMLYKEEKKNYFGVMLKREEDLVLGRPEGLEIKRIEDISEEAGEEAASSKPILLRESCDLCEDEEPYCVRFCPTNAITGG